LHRKLAGSEASIAVARKPIASSRPDLTSYVCVWSVARMKEQTDRAMHAMLVMKVAVVVRPFQP